ncbi:MAG: LysR family transcriptional regulator [Sulfuriferula sp.]|nr:LysR family transcriptional regulator [Sulfuriferula sp.]
MAVTLKQLRVFLTIAQESSITIAADKLCLTKPALSITLGGLERDCGHTLFDRHNGRLYLNDYGRHMLPLADEIIQRSDSIAQLFEHQDADIGHLRIGASHTIGHQIVPRLLQQFRLDIGRSGQSVFIANTAEICDKLERFELDIGMIEGAVELDTLEVMDWREDRMLVVAAPDHALARNANEHAGPLDIGDLEGQDWVLRESGSGTRDYFIGQIAMHLQSWRTALELNATEAVINAVAAGMGLTCISALEADFALKDGRLTEIPTTLDLRRKLRLVIHGKKYRSPLIARYLAFCQQFETP